MEGTSINDVWWQIKTLIECQKARNERKCNKKIDAAVK